MIYLSDHKPRHPTGGEVGRGEARQGERCRPGPGRAAWRGSVKGRCLVSSSIITKTIVLEVSSEARKSQILCQPSCGGQNLNITRARRGVARHAGAPGRRGGMRGPAWHTLLRHVFLPPRPAPPNLASHRFCSTLFRIVSARMKPASSHTAPCCSAPQCHTTLRPLLDSNCKLKVNK